MKKINKTKPVGGGGTLSSLQGFADQTIRHAEFISASHETLKSLPEDPFCTKSKDFGKRRRVQGDESVSESHLHDTCRDINPDLRCKHFRHSELKATESSYWINHRLDCFARPADSGNVTRNDNSRIAFTLAEVLITLGIIGVVAALTMPVLIAKHQEQVTVNRLLKAYSIVSNAYLMARNDYGPINEWFSESSSNVQDDEGNDIWSDVAMSNADLLFDRLSPYMQVLSRCSSTATDCQKYEHLYNLLGNDSRSKTKSLQNPVVTLADGITLHGGYITLYEPYCTENKPCGDFGIDVNGINKGPNAFGKDIFMFHLMKDSIIPLGSDRSTITFNRACNRTNTSYLNSGYGCTAWVLYNKNMDYLHCDDLSWQGKTKCK